MVEVLGIIQARITSSRLPNKVLKPLFGPDWSIIKIAVNRLSLSKEISKVVVAIPDNNENDLLAKFLVSEKIEFYRGSEEDVLSRYCDGIRLYNPRFVIRATSDNPLVDYENIDYLIRKSIDDDVDYSHYLDCPLGLGVEFCRATSLLQAEREATSEKEREHVCPFLYLNTEKFNCKEYSYPFRYNMKTRFTIDTEADYSFVKSIFEQTTSGYKLKNEEIKSILESHPEFLHINNRVHQKTIFE